MDTIKTGLLAGAVALALIYIVANTEWGRKQFFAFRLPGAGGPIVKA